MGNDSKRYFTSRIIEDLDARIRACTSNEDRNILFAQKAFALARHSLIPEAKKLIHDLRIVNQAYEPRLSAWIMFSEGVIEHSQTFDVAKSKDRILRAHLVGQVANDPTLAGTSAAWLAHFAFVQGSYVESREFLRKAFDWSPDEAWECRARACMVLGFGFYFAGDLINAKLWFQQARDHAIRSGDIAMQNIILFNASAFHVAQLTLLDCTTGVDPAELHFAVMSAQSAGNLNNALGIANQSSMVPVQRAELLTIEKKWREAIEIFNAHIDSSIEEGQSKWAPKFFAQRAWCKANISDTEGARNDIQLATEGADACTDPDDRGILHLRIASSAQMLDDKTLEAHHRNLAGHYLAVHSEHQSLVKKYFSEIAESISRNKNPA
jgi:tetratricopeptide (TPR) repeat protein